MRWLSVRSVIFLVGCLVAASFSWASVAKKQDKEVLSLLRYRWNLVTERQALSHARQLRSLLQRPMDEKSHSSKKHSRGKKGIRGPKGEKGFQGEQGLPGEQGPQGKEGLRGERGAIGEQGLQGEQGLVGERGATGEMGPTGPKGDPGERGATGATGPRGSRGKAGEEGPVGPTGPTGVWETQEGELSVVFRPAGGFGEGYWQAIIISPSGKKYTSRVDEGATGDVQLTISPVEMGVYTLCWKNNFESPDEALLLREIEIDSEAFNGEHISYKGLPTSHSGEQRSLLHVVVK